MTILDDVNKALNDAGFFLVTSSVRIPPHDKDALFIENALIIKRTKTVIVPPKVRDLGAPVPRYVANCACADWTYLVEMGEWPKGGHHPNCEVRKKKRHE